jgi:hypothetical protein
MLSTVMNRPARSLAPMLISTWGVLGVILLFSQAMYRLGGRAVEAITMQLTTQQLVVLVGWTIFNAYAEGYRAFQKRFSPRVVVRAHYLAANPTPLHVALAPFYCMGLIHSARKEKVIAWTTTVMILCFILLLRHVPQPWRGIVDAGVVAALAWGAVTILVLHARALVTAQLPDFPPGLPDERA